MAAGLRSKTMQNTEDMKKYIEELIKPLATDDVLQETLEKFKTDIVSRFESKIKEQDDRITKLESNLVLKQNTVDILLEKLNIKSDDNEQYSRRGCLRIHGLEWDESKTEDVDETLEKCFVDMNVPYDPNEIDRVHRIGKPYVIFVLVSQA